MVHSDDRKERMLSSNRHFTMRYVVGAMRKDKYPVNVHNKKQSQPSWESGSKVRSAALRATPRAWCRIFGAGSAGARSGQAIAPKRTMGRLVKAVVLLVPLISLGVWSGNAYAATCTSIAAAAWNLQTTWGGAGIGCVGAPGGIPGAADNATIATNVILDNSRSVTNLTINLGATLTLNTFTLTVSGNITINGTVNDPVAGANGIIQSTGNAAVLSGGGNVSGETRVEVTGNAAVISGDWNFSGTTRLYTSGTAPSIAAGTTLTFSGTSQMRTGRTEAGATVAGSVLTINGTITSTVASGGGDNFLRLYANSTIISATGVIDAAPSEITYQSNPATLTNNGSVTIQDVVGANAANNWTNAAGSTLNVSGALMATGSLTATAAVNTVNYTGAAQTGKVTTYNNLTLSGSGAKTFATTPTVNGILSMEGTATVTVTGAGVVTYGANATLQYNTANPRTVSSEEWLPTFTASGGVIITNTGTITLNAAKIFNASVPLTINSGASLATNNLQVTFGGDFVNGGTFTAGSSPIVIANTMATQSIAGFTTTGLVSMTKTAGAATFTGNVNGAGLTINGAGGTLNLGAGLTHTFTGAWTRTAGALNGGSGTLNIGGSCSGSGGTFTADTSTVNWNAVGAQTVCPVNYYNLTLSNSGAKTMTGVTTIGGNLSISNSATMTGNAAFTVAGALNYTSTGATTLTAGTPISIGTFNQSAGTLNDSGNTITVTGTGANTWTRSGGAFTASGTVIFTGTAPQIGASNFNNLTINVGAGNTAALTGNAALSGMLTLTSGLISTGANILDVGASCVGLITGGSTEYVVGNLSMHYPTNAGTTTCTFPIGDAAGYTPVTAAMANVTSTLANSILTARTDPGDHPDSVALISGIDPGKSVNRTWTLTSGGALSFGTYSATFSFLSGDIDGGANTANFIIGRKSGGVWTYPTVGAKNPNDTTATGITQAGGFGVFAIGERAMPSITTVKAVQTFSDPYNNTTNPKVIPGSVMLYTVTVLNSGMGGTDADTTVITDLIPLSTSMCVSTLCSNPPVTFTCSATPACGLTYTYATSVTYTNQLGGVGPYNYTPIPDASGYDESVTGFQVIPSGTFNGAGAQFIIQFRVRVK